jgi:hypothetical protein
MDRQGHLLVADIASGKVYRLFRDGNHEVIVSARCMAVLAGGCSSGTAAVRSVVPPE